MLNYSKQQ
jgi:DNA-binding CsgD family transcriptional regulator